MDGSIVVFLASKVVRHVEIQKKAPYGWHHNAPVHGYWYEPIRYRILSTLVGAVQPRFNAAF